MTVNPSHDFSVRTDCVFLPSETRLFLSSLVSDYLHSRAATIDSPPTRGFTIGSGFIDGCSERVHFEELVCLFSRQYNLVHDSIERLAVQTLHAQKVPRLRFGSLFTIIAGDIDNTTQIRWDRLEGNSLRHGVPGRHHAFACFGRLFANRTTRVVRRQLPEAIPVNGVPTGHLVRGGSGTE